MTQKFLCFMLSVIILGCFFAGEVSAAYYDEGNDGDSWETAYVIDSVEDLKLMSNRLQNNGEPSGKYYKLSADIDLTSTICDRFSGHLDGQGHTINVNISRQQTYLRGTRTYKSLFGVIYNDSSVEEVSIKNLNVTGSIEAGGIGVIAHDLKNGVIDNCNFNGTLDADSYNAGGIVNTIEKGTIRNCHVTGNISTKTAAGGIAGICSSRNYLDVIIENCTFEGTLSSSGDIGGIIGSAEVYTNSLVLAGNTWPSQYPEVGSLNELNTSEEDHSNDIYPYSNDVSNNSANYLNEGNNGDSWTTAYVIDSVEDLKLMRDRINAGSDDAGKYYKLSSDIDLTSETDWEGIGTADHSFRGHFDGQNHIISIDISKTLSAENDNRYVGLFGYVDSEYASTITIGNLHVKGTVNVRGAVDIKNSAGSALGSAGGIVGYLSSGFIDNCSFEGTVKEANIFAGGIVARMIVGTIRNCTVQGNILCCYEAGGIVARMESGHIDDCLVKTGTQISLFSSTYSETYNEHNLSSGTKAGGIVGSAYGEGEDFVNNCLVEGVTFDGGIFRGGIIGSVFLSIDVYGNTWPSQYPEIGKAWNLGDNVTSDYTDEGNDGSSWETAYIIDSAADFTLMRDRINAGSDDAGKYYKLSSDIDLTSETDWGYIFFKGHFDGQGYTVNVSIDRSNYDLGYGINGEAALFYNVTNNSSVEEVSIKNLNVAGTVKGYGVGGIIYALERGIIENCSFNGTLEGYGDRAGGIAAIARGGTIQNCTVSADISGNQYSGGIVGSVTPSYNVILSGNTWPSQYPEVGSLNENTSSDIVPDSNDVNNNSANYLNEGNDGSSWETAYIIDSAEDFKMMRDRCNDATEGYEKYYKLDADIDITSEQNWIPIAFNGKHLDGQNHTIKVDIDTDSYNYAGLFDTLHDASIKNLNISGSVKGHNPCGIVHFLSSGVIENCSFNGTIEAKTYSAGGIVNQCTEGTIRNCTVSGKISAITITGGIVGEVDTVITVAADEDSYRQVIIENCRVEEGTILTASSDYVGGIVGMTTQNGLTLSGNTWPSQYPQIGNADNISAPNSPESSDTHSDNSQYSWNGHRYQLYNEALTWEQAKSRCELLGGHLVTITSQTEQDFINSMLSQVQSDYPSCWLGAKVNSSGFWEWLTDEVFELQYDNFALGQPDGSGIYLQIFTASSTNSGEWDDTEGTSSARGFICEWDEEQPQIDTAPLASDFEEWLANPEKQASHHGDHYYGAVPEPIDTSHLKNNPPKAASSVYPAVYIAAESSYDGRTKIGLPDIKNQGKFLTCWAFASIGAMEADYKAQKFNSIGNNIDLSELHLAWFVYKDSDSTSKDILNLRGNSNKAVALLTRIASSPVYETSMPYETAGTEISGSDERITSFLNGRKAGSFDKARISLAETRKIDPVSDNDIVKNNIKEHGGIYVSYVDDHDTGYNNEKHTYYSRKTADDKKQDGSDNYGYHAVLLVGWNDNMPASDFNNSPSRSGAWLVRNSWGNFSGSDKGYFWMSYEQELTGGTVFIVREETENIAKNPSDNQGMLIRGHDTQDSTGLVKQPWSANIFRSERNETLKRVGFYTSDNNVHYDIYVNKLTKTTPRDPGKAEKPLCSGDIDYAGYHTVDLSDDMQVKLSSGDYYSVIVKLTNTSGYEYHTGVETTIRNYSKAEVNKGESFFASSFGSDVPSVWKDGYDDSINACIKAFTTYRPSNEEPPRITTSSLEPAAIGENYNVNLSGVGVTEWRLGNEKPAGIFLTPQGVLTGTPSESGTYTLTITALNDAYDSDTKNFTLVVGSGSSNSNLSSSEGGGSGGCNSGFTMMALCIVMILKKKQ